MPFVNAHNSVFRNENGKRMTHLLFYETCMGNHTHVMYTLKDKDYKGYTSLYRVYMEMEDITEFEFATRYFESFEHWERVSKTAAIKDHANRWRKELTLKLQARALKSIINEAMDEDSKNSFSANKYILAKGWDTTVEKAKGSEKVATTKEEVVSSVKGDSSIMDDYERMKANKDCHKIN